MTTQIEIDVHAAANEMTDALERVIDAWGLAGTIFALSEACDEKAEHIRHNWQDEMTACLWVRFSLKLSDLAMQVERHKELSK